MTSQYDAAHRDALTPGEEPSTGQLVSRLSQDMSQLVRDELRLAKVEISGKAKQTGIGAGMFGASGLLALYGAGVLIAAIVLALALAMPAWAAALVVAVVLLAAAGVAALLGKKRIAAAGPPVPERTVENVKRDVDAIRHPEDH
jgi:uncharacterized membrane protein YqjE